MEFITVLFVAIGLSMDAFAVSLGVGTTQHASNRSAKFRLAFHFGFFQFMMTALGWLAGSAVAGLIERFDHWIALVLLVIVGVNMIRSGFNPDQESYPKDPSRGGTLMMLSVATSIDALAVGLSMAMLKQPILQPSLIIGAVTFLLSSLALFLGNRLGVLFGKRMEILGGLVLIGIGVRVMITHISG